jgi:hypothetical protein
MHYYARLCSCLLGGVFLSVGLIQALGWWFGQESSMLRLVRSLVFEAHRSEALLQRKDVIEESLSLKRAIVDEILAGRLTLREAALRFAEANEMIDNNDDPGFVAEYRLPTTQEGVCIQVLGWVRNGVCHMPPREAERILTPLENEFREIFGKAVAEIVPPDEGPGDEAEAPSARMPRPGPIE